MTPSIGNKHSSIISCRPVYIFGYRYYELGKYIQPLSFTTHSEAKCGGHSSRTCIITEHGTTMDSEILTTAMPRQAHESERFRPMYGLQCAFKKDTCYKFFDLINFHDFLNSICYGCQNNHIYGKLII
jgi:hypothetical protein